MFNICLYSSRAIAYDWTPSVVHILGGKKVSTRSPNPQATQLDVVDQQLTTSQQQQPTVVKILEWDQGK